MPREAASSWFGEEDRISASEHLRGVAELGKKKKRAKRLRGVAV